MHRDILHTEEVPPEQMVLDSHPFPIMRLAQMAWLDPEVRLERMGYPDAAAWLFRTASGQYLFVIMDSRERAADYAASYELTIVASYQGGIWSASRAQRTTP
jgi:hypothetical protein